jgi:hypothetical protein
LDWYRTIPYYSSRDLIYAKDKLPAISGYAHKLHETIGGKYLAGLWEMDLVLGLLWYAQPWDGKLPGDMTRKPPVERAPSWSWASLDGRLEYTDSWYRNTLLASFQVLQCSVTPTTKDPFSEVSGGVLRVSGPLELVLVVAKDEETREDNLHLIRTQADNTNGPPSTNSRGSPILSGTPEETVAKCSFDIENIEHPNHV